MSGGAFDPWAGKIVLAYKDSSPAVPTPKTYTDAVTLAKSLFPSLRDAHIRFKTNPVPKFGNIPVEITPEQYSAMAKHDSLVVLNISTTDVPDSQPRLEPLPKIRLRVPVPAPATESKTDISMDEDEDMHEAKRDPTFRPGASSAAEKTKSNRATRQAWKGMPIMTSNDKGSVTKCTFLNVQVPVLGGWTAVEAALCQEPGSMQQAQMLMSVAKQFLCSARGAALPISGARTQRNRFLGLVDRFKFHVRSLPELQGVPERLGRIEARAKNGKGKIVLNYDAAIFMILHTASSRIATPGFQWKPPPMEGEKALEIVDLTVDADVPVNGDGDVNAKIEEDFD